MKMLKKAWNLLTTILVVFVLLMALMLVGVRLIGMKPLYVMSGSMEPAIHVGSLIFVKQTDPADIQVGDVITYTLSEAGDYSTHRVIGVEKYETGLRLVQDENGQNVLDEDGNPVYEEYPLDETCYYFQTKGDANDSPDGAPVYYKNVVGIPRLTLPGLGRLAHWLQTPRGKILGISIALVAVILTFLPDMLRWVDDSDSKKKQTGHNAQEESDTNEAGKE